MIVLKRNMPPLYVIALALVFFWALLSSAIEAPKNSGVQTYLQAREAAPTNEVFVELSLPRSADHSDRLLLLSETPLFAESRRKTHTELSSPEDPLETNVLEEAEPKVKERIQAKARPPELPALEYLGYVREGDQIRVLLSLHKTSEEKWVQVGDKVLNWQVKSMTESLVHLEQGEVEHIVVKME